MDKSVIFWTEALWSCSIRNTTPCLLIFPFLPASDFFLFISSFAILDFSMHPLNNNNNTKASVVFPLLRKQISCLVNHLSADFLLQHLFDCLPPHNPFMRFYVSFQAWNKYMHFQEIYFTDQWDRYSHWVNSFFPFLTHYLHRTDIDGFHCYILIFFCCYCFLMEITWEFLYSLEIVISAQSPNPHEHMVLYPCFNRTVLEEFSEAKHFLEVLLW